VQQWHIVSYNTSTDDVGFSDGSSHSLLSHTSVNNALDTWLCIVLHCHVLP